MKVISNTAISLDGKITTNVEDAFFLGSEKDREEMSRLRAGVDAILIGGNTFRNWPIPHLPRQEHMSRDYLETPLWNVIVSRKMDFEFRGDFFTEKRVRPLFLTNAKTLPEHIPFETIQTQNEVTPSWIVNELEKKGIQKLLIEGGGNLLAQFLAANLLDEMYVTLTPKIIGGDAPSLIQGHTYSPDHLKQLQLLEVKQVGNELFLHYQVKK